MQKLNKARISLKEKLLGRKRVLASWTSLAHPSITEIFSRMEIDFIGIDIEHSTIDQQQSQRIIAACQANGTLCLPRVATHSQEQIKRLLDSGADGIIVPMVSNADEVRNIISWFKYPPVGKRGYGIARAQGYGFDFADYTNNWNNLSSLIVQIESIQAVENIDEILSFKEIDGVMVGPYDISGSLNVPGQLDHPKVKKACQRVIKACAKYGKACGTQDTNPSLDSVEKYFTDGFTFVVLASDVFLLWKWSEKMRGIMGKLR